MCRSDNCSLCLLICALLVSIGSPGCRSFDSAAMGTRCADIENRHRVKVDLSKSTPLLGNTDRTLNRIEKALEPFPKRYTTKMAQINVVEDHIERWGLIAPLVASYTEAGRPEQYGQIFIKNKSMAEDVLGVLSGDVGLHLEHEGWHSVEYFEIRMVESFVRERALNDPQNIFQVLSTTDVVLANATPTELAELTRSDELTPYVELVRGWMFSHFGDVNGDGALDDEDVVFVDSNRRRFDTDGDGKITYADVARETEYDYLWTYNPMDLRLQLGMTASLALGMHDDGFVSFHAQNFPWEDRAETVNFVAKRGLVPYLYRKSSQAGRVAEAWKEFERIRRRDPVLARKIELIVRYIATHEKPELLDPAWKTFASR